MARRTSISLLGKDSWKKLECDIEVCCACARLVRWREEVSRVKRRAHLDADYWGKPVPSFGPRDARILMLGLAPGAHGANRTGRPFTGDGAGPFLYGALHRAGFSSAPQSLARDDGLVLRDVRISNAVRCVPPGNKPSPAESARCAPFLDREIELLDGLRVVVCLGEISWRAAHAALTRRLQGPVRRRVRFGHGSLDEVGGIHMLGSYHPSQLNTRTGRLTQTMFDSVLARAKALAGK